MRMEEKQRHKSVPEYHHQMKRMEEWDGRRRKPRMDGFVSGEIVYSSKIEWEIDFFPKDVVFISAHPGEHAAKKNGGMGMHVISEAGDGTGRERVSPSDFVCGIICGSSASNLCTY